MRNSTLIFIPYQDTDNFYEDGILTREFAMLFMLHKMGFTEIINIKKPRTFLDKRRYSVNSTYYPEGTVEGTVKKICDDALTIQYLPFISVQQIIKRRRWWPQGYKKTISLLDSNIPESAIVYSDNPFAEPLLRYLKDEKSCYLYFDVMDNFAIHPSLNKEEHEVALKNYKAIMTYADSVSANSEQTCKFIHDKTGRDITLVKNGVFLHNEIQKDIYLAGIEEVRNAKKRFTKCVGYIGKLGLRLDENLIEEITSECSDILFVFVGPFLKGQINPRLQSIISEKNNVMHIDGIPSAYVYSMLNEFDLLMIPHSVGKGENGGDPLKLYQYLTRNKPIITTNILGVSEFKDYIKISNNVEDWIEFLEQDSHKIVSVEQDSFIWETRFKPIKQEIEQWMK